MKGQTLEYVAKKLGSVGSFSQVVKGVCIDSRQVEKGSVFFALKGERVDGHAFLEEVAKKGAVGAVVLHSYSGDDFGLPLLYVKDVMEALHTLAKEAMSHLVCQIVGITGSVGKTTTKDFLATLVEGSFHYAKSPLSYNSQATFPLTILNAKGDENLFILEMAMSEPGQIKELVSIAPPDIGVITKIGRSHTAFFPQGIEGVAAAKGEILSHERTQVGIVHEDELIYEGITKSGNARLVTFGRKGADFLLREVGEKFQIVEQGVESPLFSLPFSARHLCENFLAAACVARRLGLSWDKILLRAQHLRAVTRRFEIIQKNGVTFVNDSYNASAESTHAALSNLPQPQKGGKRIFVFGEMRELGDLSKQSHEEVAQVAVNKVDQCLCLGQECEPIIEAFLNQKKPAQMCFDFFELQDVFSKVVAKGDVVLIKGANSHQLWRLLEEL
jgi:UDP-N-acetylmuramoyl-tripeptide--D-alanyl-D-alanine ligase